MITVGEAAERIGLTAQAVRDLIRRGELPGSVRFGSSQKAPFQVPAAAVDAYLKRRAKKKAE